MVLLKASRGVKLEKALETWKTLRDSKKLKLRRRRPIALLAVVRQASTLLAPFRIFRYVTFRTAFASLTALFTGLIVGPLVIQRLREFQIGQYIREEGPKAHQKKAGTPTMGGVLIAISIVVPTLLWADLSNIYVWLAVFSTWRSRPSALPTIT